jgi:hypothetical protein
MPNFWSIQNFSERRPSLRQALMQIFSAPTILGDGGRLNKFLLILMGWRFLTNLLAKTSKIISIEQAMELAESNTKELAESTHCF